VVVHVRDDSFGPQVQTVAAGTTVEWRWAGASPHDVTFDGFASPVQTSGTYSHSFTRAGAYAYRCTLHEHMLGEVVVH
jgi:plastocyanin